LILEFLHRICRVGATIFKPKIFSVWYELFTLKIEE